MEHAPLRPVPARPAGPIDPAAALREVGAWLPTLPPLAARALALVVLSERPRSEVAAALEVSEEELGRQLAAARKELRQTVVTLGGSGWCERAEGLISDRLDGALADRDTRRLDVHLRNCPRCVEHERRLVQTTDALVGGLGGPARGPAPAAEGAPLVEATPPDDGIEEGLATGEEPGPAEAAPAEAAPTEAAPTEGAPDDGAPRAVPAGDDVQELGPAPDQIAAAAEVLVAARARRQVAAAFAWNSLIVLAILLTLATIALTIAGILGAKL